VDATKIAKELVNHGDGPGPGELIGVLDEALHLLHAGVDSLELQSDSSDAICSGLLNIMWLIGT
jgi:hypothetical protein